MNDTKYSRTSRNNIISQFSRDLSSVTSLTRHKIFSLPSSSSILTFAGASDDVLLPLRQIPFSLTHRSNRNSTAWTHGPITRNADMRGWDPRGMSDNKNRIHARVLLLIRSEAFPFVGAWIYGIPGTDTDFNNQSSTSLNSPCRKSSRSREKTCFSLALPPQVVIRFCTRGDRLAWSPGLAWKYDRVRIYTWSRYGS